MRIFKWLLLLLLLLVLVLFAAPLVAFYLGLQSQPAVEATASAQPQDIAQFKVLLSEHDPYDLAAAETRQVYMTQREMNIGIGVISPLGQRQDAQVAITPGLGALHYSLRIPPNPVGEYFNASLIVSESRGKLALENLTLGDTSLSGLWLTPLIRAVDGVLQLSMEEYRDSRAALQSIRLGDGAAEFVYSLDGELVSRIEARGRSFLLSDDDQDRVRAYYQEIVAVSQSVGSSASLTRLLQPLFSLARTRSEAGNAAAENRALLLTLGLALRGSSVRWLLGEEEAALMDAPRSVGWNLYGRHDLAQHFGISAALAVGAGGVFADAVGAFKELSDSRGGTGFSFVDLLADRAGVVLAGHATDTSAVDLQQFMSRAGLRESDILPNIRKLPEGLTEMTFRSRYRDLDDARYAEIKGEVDVRIERLPLYRTLENKR